MFTILNTQIQIPAIQVAKRLTKEPGAWLHGYYVTVQLYGDVTAIRVHMNAGSAASIHKHLAAGAGPLGRWFAIGDFVQTYSGYRNSRALPAHFTHISICTLLPGTVLNVGRCSPLFGHEGRGEQAELIDGPTPTFRTLESVWSNEFGRA